MSGVRIVRQTSIDYSDSGASGYSTDSFVKIEIEFRTSGALRLLKGAPLSVFVCLALHEASNQPGASLTDLVNETGYSRPTVSDAVGFLKDPAHKFIDECGAERDGTQRYRVAAYAWFGARGGGKISLPPGVQKTFSPVVDVVTDQQNLDLKQQQLFCAESKNIFHLAGVGEPGLSKLSNTVAPERARMWCDWLGNPPASFKRPIAYSVKRLLEDPSADPPGWTLAMWRKWCEEDAAEQAENAARQTEEKADLQEPPLNDLESRYFRDGTGEIWHAAIRELKLQMTRDTFDAWLKGASALGWEDKTCRVLVIGVQSIYAKEWLENRLHMTVQRTVTGIVGHSVGVRYELAGV